MSLNKMTLPIVLISAADIAAAESVISDLLEGETMHPIRHDQVIWELHNKYYSCKVMVTSCPDDVFPLEPIEAHLVYLKPGEDEANAQARIRNVVADIRLLATRTAPSDALRQWCVDAHYELVSLDPIPDEDDDEDDAADGRGAARLRAALHAHTWPNLQRNTHNSDAAVDIGSELAVDQLSELMSMVEEISTRARTSTDDEQRRRAAAAGLEALMRAMGDVLGDHDDHDHHGDHDDYGDHGDMDNRDDSR